MTVTEPPLLMPELQHRFTDLHHIDSPNVGSLPGEHNIDPDITRGRGIHSGKLFPVVHADCGKFAFLMYYSEHHSQSVSVVLCKAHACAYICRLSAVNSPHAPSMLPSVTPHSMHNQSLDPTHHTLLP